ncbi:MAG: glycine oxidase ThiO [Planctomycetaceae bacterium]
MSGSPDILIIGGGVIGLSTAVRLASRGASVRVVDRQPVGLEASWAGAGMLPPGNAAHAHSPEARLRAYSDELWDDFSRWLRDLTGIDNGFHRCGAVELNPDPGSDAFGAAVSLWRAEQIRMEKLNRSELEQRIPGLSSGFSEGVFLPDFGQARNPRHLKSLKAACQILGVDIEEGLGPIQLESSKDQTVVARSATGRAFSGRICVSAGAWTPHLMRPLGLELPIEPVRGQIVLLKPKTRMLTSVVEVGRRYLVPRPDGLVLVGSTLERCGFEKRTTSSGVSELLQFAHFVVPGLAEASVEKTWAGLRPGSPDQLPYLGRISRYRNLFIGAGHFRSGLQMSTGTSAILADLLLDASPAIPLNGLEACRGWGE